MTSPRREKALAVATSAMEGRQSKIMHLSRRDFLSYAACLPAGPILGASRRSTPLTLLEGGGSPSGPPAPVLLLGSSCALQESLEGYRTSLSAAGIPVASTGESARLVLVPAAALSDFNEVRLLRKRAEGGATVLVESGAAFLSQQAFRIQRGWVREQFSLTLLNPIRLWDGGERLHGPPYLDFHWPSRAKIRDFSRIVPLKLTGGQVIATQENQMIGVRRRLGAGTLVFLGSPIGPHLLAGDREARRWFATLSSTALNSRL